jgi:hypothetical protein
VAHKGRRSVNKSQECNSEVEGYICEALGSIASITRKEKPKNLNSKRLDLCEIAKHIT